MLLHVGCRSPVFKFTLFPVLSCRDEVEGVTKGEISTVCGQTVLRMSSFKFHLSLLSKVLLYNFSAEIPLNTPTFLTLLFHFFKPCLCTNYTSMVDNYDFSLKNKTIKFQLLTFNFYHPLPIQFSLVSNATCIFMLLFVSSYL